MALAINPDWLQTLTSSSVSRGDIVAWWGAIAGTLALGWDILRQVQSKGRLDVEVIYQVDRANPFLPPVFAVRVTNAGSKPVLVQGIAIQQKKRCVPSHHFFPCEVPVMLARGKHFVQVIDRTGWLPTGAKKLYVWDSSGKHWYLGRKKFRWLVHQHRRFIAAEWRQAAAV